MDQEITVNPNFIKHWKKNLNSADFYLIINIFDKLKENVVVVSDIKKFVDFIDSELERFNATERDFLKKIITEFYNVSSSRFKIIKSFKINQLHELLKLCVLTSDKIYLDKELVNYPENQIEFHNVNTFVDPTPNNRLKHKNYKIKLENNVEYKLESIFKPYLKNCKSFKIIDPYLPNKTSFHHFKYLNSFLPKDIEREVFVLRQEIYLRNKKYGETEYSNFEKFIQENNFKVIYLEPGHVERSIQTDKVIIRLPGGLDCFDNNCKAKIKNPDSRIILIEPNELISQPNIT
ncbi:MAG: hypothetical protein IAE91_12660 [Ignavibacteriaceae bacterium]|nr:hypothetical protein [Ignavibacteriaceae bacterium]